MSLRYALLARVSTAIQAERETIQLQIDAYEEHRKRHDYTPTKIYEDDGESGELPLHKRPGGREMLADAQAKLFDVLVVYSVSRLARTALESLRIVKMLKEDYGIGFMSISEPVDTTTPAGWLAFTNLAAFYEFEKATILDRTRNGKKALMRDGILPDGKTRYGWRRENLDRVKRKRHEARLVEDELQAPVVREIFRLFVYERMGSVLIADLLTARGVPPAMEGKRLKERLSGVWHPGVVRQILKREAYATGRIPYNQTKRVKKDGEVIGRDPRDEEEWAWIEAPPLIDRATFDLAQERLGANLKRMNKNGIRSYPLRGRFVCLRCQGLSFVGRVGYYTLASGERIDKPFYSCLSRWKRGAPDRCHTNLRAEPLEAQVWEHVRELLTNAESYADEVTAEWERLNACECAAKDPEEDLEHVAGRLDELEKESQAIRDMVRTGFATQEEAAKDMGKVREQQARLKAIQARLLAAPPSPGKEDVAEAARMARHWLEKLRRAVGKAEQDESLKEELVRLLLVRIEVDGKDANAFYAPPPPDNQSPHLSRYGLQLLVRRRLEIPA